MSYQDPSQPADADAWRALIAALRDNHIRPLILLNANSGLPGPAIVDTNARLRDTALRARIWCPQASTGANAERGLRRGLLSEHTLAAPP